MTLLDVMIAVTILTAVMGILFSLSIGIGDTAQVMSAKATATDEARRAMIYIVRDLREAATSSISGPSGPSITYRVAADMDGNGTAVDVGGNLELSTLRTIERDTADLNHDGQTTDQLVLHGTAWVRVIGNYLCPNEDANNNGVLDAGEDLNHNGVLDHGIWFERSGGAVVVHIETENRSRQGHVIVSRLTETVVSRN
jgi:hypothetical protein